MYATHRAIAFLTIWVVLIGCEKGGQKGEKPKQNKDASAADVAKEIVSTQDTPGPLLDTQVEPLKDVLAPRLDVSGDAVLAPDTAAEVSNETQPPSDASGTVDACGTVTPGAVTLYRPSNQAESTTRPCLCFPYGTFCRWPDWANEAAPKSLEDETKACPADEACDGWYDGQFWLSGDPQCRKRCYHPEASWDKGKFDELGCADGEYCKLVGFAGADGLLAGLHGLCYPIPVSVDVTNCVPACSPKQDACE